MSTKQSKTRKSERRAAEQQQQQQSESVSEATTEHQPDDLEEELHSSTGGVTTSIATATSSTMVSTVTKKVTSLLTGTPIASESSESGAASSSSSRGGGGSRRRSRSPLGISREQEKEELAHLNTKLACYIEFVRSQQHSADTVRRQYETLSESATQEFSQSTGLYEREIGSLRQQLDRLAGERAELQLSLDKAAAERAQAEKRAAGLERSLREQEQQMERAAEAEADAREQRAEAERLRGRLAAAEKEAASAAKELAGIRKAAAGAERSEREVQRLQAELQDSQAQLRTFRDQLETEVKLKTELENRVQTAQEEASFRENLLREERSRFHERSVMVEEVSRVQEAEYESRLCEELRRAREEADIAAASFRQDLEVTFKAKMEELRTSSDRYSQDARGSREELVELRRRVHDSGLQLEKALSEAELLRANNARLEEALRQERRGFEEQLEFLRQEERHNRERLAEQLDEYNNLLTSKLALDQEILAYRQLLDEEQRRTNYSPHSRHGHKRRFEDDDDDELSERRYSVSQEQLGLVQLSEVDPAGQFVRLRNTSSDTETGLGGWTVRCEAGGGTGGGSSRTMEFRFPAKTVLPPQSDVTVFGSDSGQAANPPAIFVSKQASFGTGNAMSASLLDSKGQEVAWRKMTLEHHEERHVRGKRRLKAGETPERCSLM